MMKWIRIGVLASVAAATASADTPAAAPLEPNGPWVIEAQESLCMLTRSYGPDAAKVTVGLQPLFRLQTMEVFLISAGTGSGRQAGEARIAFRPDGPAERGTFVSVTMPDGRRFARLSMGATVLERARTADTMTLHAGAQTATIRLVHAAAGAAALDRCQTQLLQSWHIDEAMLAPARAPVPLTTNLAFNTDHYPRQALDQNLSGRVVAALSVGTDGGVTGCHVLISIGTTLDTATCDRARLLRFRPGKDAAGSPAPSVYILPVRWVL